MTLSTFIIPGAVVLLGILLFLKLTGRRSTLYNGRDPRMQSYGNHAPYPTYAPPPPSSFVMGLIWLCMLSVIAVVVCGIYAPGMLHAFIHLLQGHA